jgi:predicted ArsR family transcriptional regulator
LHSRGGEGRLSIKSLKKMGFTSHLSRQHIKNLEEMGVIETQGYCPVAGISKLYRLRKSALKMFIQPQPDTSSENAL